MNHVIIDQFAKLVKQNQAELSAAQMDNDTEEIKKQSFRLGANKKALVILKNIDFKIKTVDDLKNSGLGKGSIARIKEILENGELAELTNKYNNKKQKLIDSIQELEGVIGIGPKTAKKLVVENKISSVAELKKAIKNNKITVSDKIKLGLKYYGVVDTIIPRKEITATEKFLQKIAHSIDEDLEIIICGSYRRGKSTSGDIDVLLYHPLYKSIDQDPGDIPFLEKYVNKLSKSGILLDDMTDKDYEKKYMGFSQYKNYPVRRIDIRYVPVKSLPFSTLYFTGPYELNTYMRKEAKKRNMILNEYGLYTLGDNGKKTLVKLNSEEEIFNKLGMDYLTPQEREKKFSVGKKNE